MPLRPGTRLGPYEIVAPLGAGGMGEVYRARDTRLGRDVALKALPASVAGDPGRLARFEAEARAVAALTHPNVLALHDVGREGEVSFAVTELVEGQTLRERLADGPLAPPRAIALAAQVAQGLAAAHDRGIVHRDLKPENVMVTPEGRAKILDFGLARRDEPVAPGSRSEAPTLVATTEPGAVLGTTGYMSPEQVRGQVVDARSDLFALGIVLHEMLAGRPPFHRDSAADTMSAILREDPPALATLVPDTPVGLQRIVERCLEKSPAARFRTAADLAFTLEALASGASSGAHATVPRTAAGLHFQRLTYRNGHIATARFTPDGAAVVYGAAWDGAPYEIFTSRTGSPESRSLGLPPGCILAMSPGGEMAVSLGFHHFSWFQVRGTLGRVPLAGGGVRALQKDVGAADWSPDGRSLAVIRYVGARCVLEYPPGKVLHESHEWMHRCRVAPDGRHVAFGNYHRSGEGEADVCVVDGDGRVTRLSTDLTNLSGIAWSPSGDEVWFSGIDAAQRHGIWSATLDGRVRDLHVSPTRLSLHDVRPDGRALVTFDTLHTGLVVGDGADGTERDLAWFDGSVACAMSDDGEQVVFAEVAEAENPHYAVYLRGADGSPAVRLGEGVASDLSPDGAWVLAATHGARRASWLYPTGFGDARELAWPGIDRPEWGGFLPDGEHVVVVGAAGGEPAVAFVAALSGGEPRRIWNEPMAFNRFFGLPISPDGERVVIQRPDGTFVELTWRSGEFRPLPGIGGGDQLIGYHADGRRVFACGTDPTSRAIVLIDLGSGERTPWRTPALADGRGVVFVPPPVVASSGRRYAYTFLRVLTNLHVVEGLGG